MTRGLQRPSSSFIAVSFLLLACGHPEHASGGAVVLRYAPGAGAAIRYHVVVRRVPGDAAGRTITAEGSIRGLSPAADEAQRVRVSIDRVHLAGEGGTAVRAAGRVRSELNRDPRNRLVGTPSTEGHASGSADALRVLIGDAVTFDEGAVGIDDGWPMEPMRRELLGEEVAIPRNARLIGVSEGVAAIEISGELQGRTIDGPGGPLEASAELNGRARIRVADGLLIEHDARLDVTLASRVGADRVGQRVWRERVSATRVVGRAPPPAAHDWQPNVVDSSCRARLTSMNARFQHAPQGLLGVSPERLEVALPQIAEGRDIVDPGPVIAARDASTLRRELAEQNEVIDRADAVYLAAPESATDGELVAWLRPLPGYIEARRLVRRPVDPPAPPRSPRVSRVAAELRGGSIEAWETAVRPYLSACGEAQRAYEETPGAPRSPLLSAFRRCGCAATDLVDLEHLLDLRFGGPGLGWVPIAGR